jgi:hypothetical protein
LEWKLGKIEEYPSATIVVNGDEIVETERLGNMGAGFSPVDLEEFDDEEVAVVIATIRNHIGRKE